VATSVVDVDIGNADFGTLATYSCPASPSYRTAFRHADSPTTRATVGPDADNPARSPPGRTPPARRKRENATISRETPTEPGAPRRPSRGSAPIGNGPQVVRIFPVSWRQHPDAPALPRADLGHRAVERVAGQQPMLRLKFRDHATGLHSLEGASPRWFSAAAEKRHEGGCRDFTRHRTKLSKRTDILRERTSERRPAGRRRQSATRRG
jgi:hypothetical protein